MTILIKLCYCPMKELEKIKVQPQYEKYVVHILTICTLIQKVMTDTKSVT